MTDQTPDAITDAPPPQLSARELAAKAQAEAATPPAGDVVQVPSLLGEDDHPMFTAQDRIDASPLHDWFPGIEWRPILLWLAGVCVQSVEPEGSTDEPITLIIEGQNQACEAVRFTNAKPWTEGVIGWWGPVVDSAAEVGEFIAGAAAPPEPAEFGPDDSSTPPAEVV